MEETTECAVVSKGIASAGSPEEVIDLFAHVPLDVFLTTNARFTVSEDHTRHLLQPLHTLTDGIYTCTDHEIQMMQRYAQDISTYISDYFRADIADITINL